MGAVEGLPLHELQNSDLQIPDSASLTEKTRDLFLLSFLMGMDHVSNDIELADIFKLVPEPVPFDEAIKMMSSRVSLSKKKYSELESQLRFRAFTVARLTRYDSIEMIRKLLVRNLAQGGTVEDFWKNATHHDLMLKLGVSKSNPWYWENVYRTNIQTDYNAGRALQFKQSPVEYYEFIGIKDSRQTPICRVRSGVIRPSKDPFWSVNWPPLHFSCRSTIRGVRKEEFKNFGLKLTAPGALKGVEPVQKGFGGNPIDTGSFYKLTPEMRKRAKQYGVLGEIESMGKELGVRIN